MKIHIDTCAGNRGYIPCCPCLIVAEDGRDILVQSDWDYPGFASTFGWSVRNVQKCPQCGELSRPNTINGANFVCDECAYNADDWKRDTGTEYPHSFPCCNHDATDGTVDCRPDPLPYT